MHVIHAVVVLQVSVFSHSSLLSICKSYLHLALNFRGSYCRHFWNVPVEDGWWFHSLQMQFKQMAVIHCACSAVASIMKLVMNISRALFAMCLTEFVFLSVWRVPHESTSLRIYLLAYSLTSFLASVLASDDIKWIGSYWIQCEFKWTWICTLRLEVLFLHTVYALLVDLS